MQSGIGFAAVADWWLGMAVLLEGETAAAAAPATTTERAKMRTTSFINDYLGYLKFGLGLRL